MDGAYVGIPEGDTELTEDENSILVYTGSRDREMADDR